MLFRRSCLLPGEGDRVKPPKHMTTSCLRQLTQLSFSCTFPHITEDQADQTQRLVSTAQMSAWEQMLKCVLQVGIGQVVTQSQIAKQQSVSGSIRTDSASTPPAAPTATECRLWMARASFSMLHVAILGQESPAFSTLLNGPGPACAIPWRRGPNYPSAPSIP